MYLHPTLAVSPAREPLGVLDAWMWAREPKGEGGTRPGEKASTRWVEGYGRVARLMRLGRSAPDLDAALLFSPEEWQAAYILSKKRPPKHPPKLNTVIRPRRRS